MVETGGLENRSVPPGTFGINNLQLSWAVRFGCFCAVRQLNMQPNDNRTILVLGAGAYAKCQSRVLKRVLILRRTNNWALQNAEECIQIRIAGATEAETLRAVSAGSSRHQRSNA